MPGSAVLPPEIHHETWEPVLALPEHPHDYPPPSYKENSPLLFRDTRTTNLVKSLFLIQAHTSLYAMNMAGTTSLLSTVKLKITVISICFLCLS